MEWEVLSATEETILMSYTIIASWDADNKVTAEVGADTEEQAQTLLASAKKEGYTNAFYVEDVHKDKSWSCLTVDPINKVLVHNQEEEAQALVISEVIPEIALLEAAVTPRRMRDAVLTDDGKKWLDDQEKRIAVERAKL